MKQHKVIISGGGSGGHIFPAIAIAKSLLEIDKNIDFLFVGASDKMEMEKIPAAGFKIIGLWISGFHRKNVLRNLLFPLKLLFSIVKSFFIILKFRPDLVIGTGGFASGPILFVASLFKIPTLIQEQNSYAGITNKLLAKYVDKICVAYDDMERFFPQHKIIKTGNPIRKNIIENTTSLEIGFENKFFNNKLGLDLTFYSATTDNQILAVRPSSSSGTYFQYVNAGKVQNQGVELQLYANVLKSGDEVLVQVVKEPISTKGPRVTSEISIAGRFIVLVPFTDRISVSQKIRERKEKDRLRKLVQAMRPKGFGVIVRTVADGASPKDLKTPLRKPISSC